MASNIPARSLKAVAATSTPFLYQTSTLGASRPALRLAIEQFSSRHPRKQCLHSSASSGLSTTKSLRDGDQERSSAPPSNADEPAPPEQPFSIRKVPASGQFNKPEPEEDVPWAPDSGVAKRDDVLSGAAEIEFDTSHDPFAFDNEDLFAEDEGDPDFSIAPAREPGETTITLEERQAFEGIFSDIYTRSQQPKEKAPTIDPQNATERLTSIMNKGVGDARPGSTVYSNETRNNAKANLSSYPRALRAAAAQAFGLNKPQKLPASEPEVQREEEVDVHADFRAEERKRVEDAMLAAPTDIALWAVMEKEIFALIPRLGFEEQKPKPAPAPPRGKARRGRGKKAAEPAPEPAPAPEAKPEAQAPLDLAIYGPLYPWYLLRALQILNNGFAKPSPLSRNVLPRIKSLGLASHILGASTAFYNELMRVYWHTYDDLRGVHDLLSDMRDTGLELDEETLGIVEGIAHAQSRYLAPKTEEQEREAQTPAAQLWHMPQYAPGMFARWQKHVGATLATKKRREVQGNVSS